MFGLPLGTDVSALQGCALESFSVSRHQVQLHLDSLKRISVSIEGDFAVTTAEGTARLYQHIPEAGALAMLLDVEIIEAVVAAPGTVTLRFGDGTSVEVYDSNEHYESYRIRIGEKLIVV